MPPHRLVALAVVLAPAVAHADDGRLSINTGVDTGHGEGSALHVGLAARWHMTPRVALEGDLERIAPVDDTKGDPVTGFGAALIYELTDRRSLIPFVRAGGGYDLAPRCSSGGNARLDAGIGVDHPFHERLYVGADVRVTRRWPQSPSCIYDREGPAVIARTYEDPWDDLTLRLTFGIGF